MAGERKDREGEGRKLSPSRISNSHQHGSFEIYSINSDDGKSDDGTRVAALFRSALRYVPLSSDDFRYSRRTSSPPRRSLSRYRDAIMNHSRRQLVDRRARDS